MYNLVCDDRYFKKKSYLKLFNYLHSCKFTYIIAMDSNREEDGVSLRYRFGYENNYPDSMIASFLDNKPCSVLEVLVALSMRCEEHIMGNPDLGNRTGKWFWVMMKNLGLLSNSDEKYVETYVDQVLWVFLNRKYKPNGEGGIFIVEHSTRDLRTVEIWYQMCWYLDSII